MQLTNDSINHPGRRALEVDDNRSCAELLNVAQYFPNSKVEIGDRLFVLVHATVTEGLDTVVEFEVPIEALKASPREPWDKIAFNVNESLVTA